MTPPTEPCRLATIRKARSLTQAQLAARACVGAATIQRLEHGRCTPHHSTLHLLANALDCEPTDILPPVSKTPATQWNDDEGRCREALARLVALKDGPRDETYERAEPLAWEQARAALAAVPEAVDA